MNVMVHVIKTDYTRMEMRLCTSRRWRANVWVAVIVLLPCSEFNNVV